MISAIIKKYQTHLPFLVTMCVLIFAGLTLLIPARVLDSQIPNSSLYGFPVSFLNDYYQYVHMIKMGQQGHLLWIDPYTSEAFPPMFLQPHYMILGMITRPLGVNPFQVYQFLLLIGVLTLIITVSLFSKSLFHSTLGEVTAIFLFITSTNIWFHKSGSGIFSVTEPETYSNWFNIYQKLTMFSAHHYFAVALFGTLVLAIAKPKNNLRTLIAFGIGSSLLAILHPYNAIVYLYCCVILTAITTVRDRLIPWTMIRCTVLSIIGIAPFILYYRQILMTVWHGQTSQENTLSWSRPLISFHTYLLALGPLVVPALLSLFFKETYKNNKIIALLLWAFLPLGLFFLPNIGIPTGGIRLSQVYHHIPLALLSAYSVIRVIKKFHIHPIAYLIVIVAAVAYAVPPYISGIKASFSPGNNFYYLNGIRIGAEPIITFLKTHTPSGSVVLAGERVSMMLPSFTDNHTVIGHDGNARNYAEKKKLAEIFLGGYMQPETVEDYLRTNKIEYIVFGYDAMAFSDMPYRTLPYFKTIYENGATSIVKVTLSQ